MIHVSIVAEIGRDTLEVDETLMSSATTLEPLSRTHHACVAAKTSSASDGLPALGSATRARPAPARSSTLAKVAHLSAPLRIAFAAFSVSTVSGLCS